ncbi:hypothetical protein FJTKL_11446 [Diaporthe vaccinii]|uniref:Uncharacterized protein n=1 Tax=Diaporthe vaccinii TaxID=105482 RepID=A0ABR4EH57_9PEZI
MPMITDTQADLLPLIKPVGKEEEEGHWSRHKKQNKWIPRINDPNKFELDWGPHVREDHGLVAIRGGIVTCFATVTHVRLAPVYPEYITPQHLALSSITSHVHQPNPHQSVIKLLIPTLFGGITVIPPLRSPPLCVVRRKSSPCAVLRVSSWCVFFPSSRKLKNAAPGGQMAIPSFLPRDMGSSPLWWKCIWVGRTSKRCLVPSKERMFFLCLPLSALACSCVCVPKHDTAFRPPPRTQASFLPPAWFEPRLSTAGVIRVMVRHHHRPLAALSARHRHRAMRPRATCGSAAAATARVARPPLLAAAQRQQRVGVVAVLRRRGRHPHGDGAGPLVPGVRAVGDLRHRARTAVHPRRRGLLLLLVLVLVRLGRCCLLWVVCVGDHWVVVPLRGVPRRGVVHLGCCCC